MRRMFRPLMLLMLAGCLAMPSPAGACPSCKDTVANGDASATADGNNPSDDANGSVAGGFNTSIYLMLAAFLGTLGLVGHAMYRGARGHHRGDQESAEM